MATLEGIKIGNETYDFPKTDAYVKTESDAKYATKTEMSQKQDALTAGDNITIQNGVISASGGGVGDLPITKGTTTEDAEEQAYFNDDESEKYASIGAYGVKSKAYLDLDGTDVFRGNFEVRNAWRALMQLEKHTQFGWKAFDKRYICLICDDGNLTLPNVLQVCNELSIPLCAAVPAHRLDNYPIVLSACRSIVENGGEILCHNGSGDIKDATATDEERWVATARQKQRLEAYGFNPRGIIRHNSSTYPSDKMQEFLVKYFDYSDKWGNANDARYNVGRTRYDLITSEEWKAQLLTLSQSNGFTPLMTHFVPDSERETIADLRDWVTYAKSIGIEFVTWSWVYDNYITIK